MENTDYLKIIALIGGVVTFIITYFNKEQNKYIKLVDDYFEKVLVKYVDLYNKDKKINPINFIQENYSMKDYFIPSYIFCLINSNRKVDLHKVLLEDYRERFPNNTNGIFRTIDNLRYTYSLFEVFIFSFLFIIPVLVIISMIISVVSLVITSFGEGFKEGMISSVAALIMIVVIIIVVYHIFKYLAKYIAKGMKDEYTMKTKEIEELIKNKVKSYDETINNYYLI